MQGALKAVRTGAAAVDRLLSGRTGRLQLWRGGRGAPQNRREAAPTGRTSCMTYVYVFICTYMCVCVCVVCVFVCMTSYIFVYRSRICRMTRRRQERAASAWSLSRSWSGRRPPYSSRPRPSRCCVRAQQGSVSNTLAIYIYTHTHAHTHTQIHVFVCVYIYELARSPSCSSAYLTLHPRPENQNPNS